MEVFTRVKENWLTQKPNKSAIETTMLIGVFLFLASFAYFQNLFHAVEWMPANGNAVFFQHQYWRLWTALFAHADIAHLLSNAILFFPFTYFLSAYFGLWFVPLLGLLFGGVTNLVVLTTMPFQTNLIGVSGVVYWLGASWLTLFLLLDRRESFRRRMIKFIVVSLVLFAPQVYKPEVSYLSHAIGYLFGIFSSIIYYWFNKKEFLSAEVLETIVEEDELSSGMV